MVSCSDLETPRLCGFGCTAYPLWTASVPSQSWDERGNCSPPLSVSNSLGPTGSASQKPLFGNFTSLSAVSQEGPSVTGLSGWGGCLSWSCRVDERYCQNALRGQARSALVTQMEPNEEAQGKTSPGQTGEQWGNYPLGARSLPAWPCRTRPRADSEGLAVGRLGSTCSPGSEVGERVRRPTSTEDEETLMSLNPEREDCSVVGLTL